MGWPCCLTQCKSARPSLYLSLVFSPIHSPTPQCQQPKQSPSVLTSPLQMQNSILHRSSPLLLCCFSANAARLRRFCRFGPLPSQVFLHQTACPLSVTTHPFYKGACSSAHGCPLPFCLCLWFPAAVRLCMWHGRVRTWTQLKEFL